MKEYENSVNGFDTFPYKNDRKFRARNIRRKVTVLLGIALFQYLPMPHSGEDKADETTSAAISTEIQKKVAQTPIPTPMNQLQQLGTSTTTTTATPKNITYSDGVQRWSYLIETWSERHGVDPCLIGAIVQRESGGDPNAHNVHTDGLMQIDGTANASVAQEYGLNHTDLYDPSNNIALGTALIAEAEEATGIDTKNDLTPWQIHEIGVNYHGIGFYSQLKQGQQLPANVTEASVRLQQNYAEYCQ